MTPAKSDCMTIGVAVVMHGNHFLIGIREADAHLPGKAEFPGGKCQPDESPAACAIRECAEETGLLVETIELLCRNTHDYPDRTVDLSFFLCQVVNRSDEMQPASPFRWVPVTELVSIDFPAGNREVIDLLLDRYGHQHEALG